MGADAPGTIFRRRVALVNHLRATGERPGTTVTADLMTAREKIGSGCIVLFLLPFCGVGVFTAIAAAMSAARGDWGQAGIFLISAVVFGGFGFGMLAGLARGRRQAKEAGRLEREHPDEPWLGRPDWAAGRIEGSSRRRMFLAWTFAVFWNLISVTVPIFVIPKALEEGEKIALLALIFPAIGLALLVWAIRLTLRHRKFGISVFRMAQVPGVIGRLLRGVIVTNTFVRPDDGFVVTLTCVNRLTIRSGGGNSTREKVLWQEERRVKETAVGQRATAIPVSFRLPPEVRESDSSDASDQIIWRLEAAASIPGVDYHASFEVPVFRTPESDVPLKAEGEEALATPDPEFRQPPDSRIFVTESLRRTEIHFSAARNLGVATGVTLFFIIWTAVTVALPKLGAPLIFPIVFGLFDLLLAMVVLGAWFATTHVVVDSSGLSIKYGMLGLGHRKTVAADDVEDITLAIGMRAGNRPYYDIRVVRLDGKKVPAGGSIRDKREAEWLVERIWKGLDIEV